MPEDATAILVAESWALVLALVSCKSFAWQCIRMHLQIAGISLGDQVMLTVKIAEVSCSDDRPERCLLGV